MSMHPCVTSSWADWARQTIVAVFLSRGQDAPAPEHLTAVIRQISDELKGIKDNHIGEGDVFMPFLAAVIRKSAEWLDLPFTTEEGATP